MSLATSNRDGGKTSESGHLRAIQKLVVGEVLEGLVVSQRAAGANMSVDLSIGDAIIPRSDGTYGHPAWNDAVLNTVVTTANGSNPRRDIFIMYIDYNQARSTAVSNNTNGVVKVKIVAGTAAGSPVDPNDAALQAAAGSGNPYIKLARIRVGTGVTTISNSVIDDLRTMASSIQQAGGPLALQSDYLVRDHVVEGCVWTGNALGSTRAGNMSAGVVFINGVALTVAAESLHTFAASKDTYVDLVDNGDGTAVPVYTAENNNAASPALAADSLRIAIVVTGASSIANVAAINQGASITYIQGARPRFVTDTSSALIVTDSLGNLICPRSPKPGLVGGLIRVDNGITTGTPGGTPVTWNGFGASVPFIAKPHTNYELHLFEPVLSGPGGTDSFAFAFFLGATNNAATTVINEKTEPFYGSNIALDIRIPFSTREENGLTFLTIRWRSNGTFTGAMQINTDADRTGVFTIREVS